jgi:hypothetical protein
MAASVLLGWAFLFLFRKRFPSLESPGILDGNPRNRKHQLPNKGEVKALLFLTGFTHLPNVFL